MWVELAIQHGAIDPAHPRFMELPEPAKGAVSSPVLDGDALEGLDELTRIATLFRSLPQPRTPEGLLERLTQAISAPPESQPKA